MNYVYDSLSWYKIFMPATIIYADSILFKCFYPIEPAAGVTARPGPCKWRRAASFVQRDSFHAGAEAGGALTLG